MRIQVSGMKVPSLFATSRTPADEMLHVVAELTDRHAGYDTRCLNLPARNWGGARENRGGAEMGGGSRRKGVKEDRRRVN